MPILYCHWFGDARKGIAIQFTTFNFILLNDTNFDQNNYFLSCMTFVPYLWTIQIIEAKLNLRTEDMYNAHCRDLNGPLRDHNYFHNIWNNTKLCPNEMKYYFHVVRGLVPDNILEGKIKCIIVSQWGHVNKIDFRYFKGYCPAALIAFGCCDHAIYSVLDQQMYSILWFWSRC